VVGVGLLLGIPPFFYPFYYGPKALIIGDAWVSSIFIYKPSPVISCFFF